MSNPASIVASNLQRVGPLVERVGHLHQSHNHVGGDIAVLHRRLGLMDREERTPHTRD